jgi:transcription elongation factor Elf1
MKLTQEQIAEYLSDPFHCPYCGSGRIEASAIVFDASPSQHISCASCGRGWTDVLRVVEIEEDEQPTEAKGE